MVDERAVAVCHREGRGAGRAARDADDIVELAGLIGQGAINDKIARQVLGGVLAGEGSPAEVVDKRGLRVVSDEGELTAVVDQVIAENPEVAEKIRAGKVAAAGALVGAVMKATRGQADAGRARELIVERLSWRGLAGRFVEAGLQAALRRESRVLSK